jgi:phosphoglycerol transferase MdoB-like AlkP superfamily enzyme
MLAKNPLLLSWSALLLMLCVALATLRIKMKANDILTSSETNTNEAIALGIEINKQVNYRGGQLNRFVSVEYKSDIRRDTSDYLDEYRIKE